MGEEVREVKDGMEITEIALGIMNHMKDCLRIEVTFNMDNRELVSIYNLRIDSTRYALNAKEKGVQFTKGLNDKDTEVTWVKLDQNESLPRELQQKHAKSIKEKVMKGESIKIRIRASGVDIKSRIKQVEGGLQLNYMSK